MSRLALQPRDRARMVLPFGVVALLPLALAPLPPAGGVALTALYAVLTLAVFLSIVALPWDRAPLWTLSLPGLVYCVALYFAREGEGGARSGLAPSCSSSP